MQQHKNKSTVILAARRQWHCCWGERGGDVGNVSPRSCSLAQRCNNDSFHRLSAATSNSPSNRENCVQSSTKGVGLTLTSARWTLNVRSRAWFQRDLRPNTTYLLLSRVVLLSIQCLFVFFFAKLDKTRTRLESHERKRCRTWGRKRSNQAESVLSISFGYLLKCQTCFLGWEFQGLGDSHCIAVRDEASFSSWSLKQSKPASNVEESKLGKHKCRGFTLLGMFNKKIIDRAWSANVRALSSDRLFQDVTMPPIMLFISLSLIRSVVGHLPWSPSWFSMLAF